MEHVLNHFIWVEKYRPNKINEILIQANEYLIKEFNNIKFTEILNIRDEIIGVIDKALYLLTFV